MEQAADPPAQSRRQTGSAGRQTWALQPRRRPARRVVVHPPPAPSGLVLLFLFAACASAGSLLKARGTGIVREFEASWEQIWKAALTAVPANGLHLDRAREWERWILATHLPQRTGSGLRENEVTLEADQGERIGIFIDSIGPNRWAVEVVTVKRFALDTAKEEWAPEIFWIIERELSPGERIRIPERAFEPPE